MDNVRGQEGRNGYPNNTVAGGSKGILAPTGFEGMNYEQKRKPYMEEKSSGKDENENPGADNKLRNRRD